MNIPVNGDFDAFSLIADINSFTKLVANHELPAGISAYVRDVLAGSITAVEECEGSVIGVMGDAIFGVLPTSDAVFKACVLIARDVDRLCSYLSGTDYEEGVPELPSLKVGVEYGSLSASTISSAALGTIPFCIGPATNYAARIIAAGVGNRCHVGPAAMHAGLSNYIEFKNAFQIEGKSGEPKYQYWKLDLSDVWIEGIPKDGTRYW